MMLCLRILTVKTGRGYRVCAPNNPIHKNLCAIRYGADNFGAHIEAKLDDIALFPNPFNGVIALL